MKVVFCTLAMLACVAAPSYSQTAGAVYAELAGPGHSPESISCSDAAITISHLECLILRKGSDVDGANASATIGYRYARPGGLFFQLAATPVFDRHGVYPWAGISIGKSY